MTFGGIKKTRSNEVTRPTLSKTSQNKEMSTANFNERFSVLNDGNDSGVDAKFQSLLHEYADNVKENNQDNEFSESLNATTKTISTFIQKKYKTEDKLGMSTVVSMLFDMPKTKPKAYQKKLFSKVFLGLVKNDSGSISKALLKNLESALNEQKQKHTTGYKQIHELFTHHLSELIENETIGLGELEDLDDLKSVVTCFGGKVGSGLIKENTGIGIGQSEFQACFKGDKGGRETAILGLKTKLTGLYDAVEDGQADELSEFAASGLKTAFESALDAKDCNAAQIFEVLKGLDFPKGNDGLDGVISHAYEKLLESDLSSPSCFLGENADAFLDSELLARCLTIGLKVFQSQERAPSDSSGSDVSKKRKAEKTKKLFLKELKKLDLDQVVVLRHIVDSQHYFDAQSWTVSSKTKTNVNVVFNVLFPEKALKQAMLDGIKGRSQDKTLSFVKKQAGTSLGLLKCIDENQDLSALQVSYGSEMWSVDYHDKKDGCHVIQLKSNSKTKTLSIDQNNVVDIDGKTIENPDSDILVKYSGFFDSKDGKTLEDTILNLKGADKALIDKFKTWKAVVTEGEYHEGVKGSIEELRGIASKAKEHKGWLVNSDNPFQQVLDGIEGRRTERGSFKRLKEDLLEKFHELCLEQGWPYDDRSATETSGRTQTGPTRTRTQHINQFLKEGQYSQAEQNFNLIQGELKEKGSSAWTKMRRLLKQASKLSDILESSKISISLNTIGIKQTGDKKTTAHETKQSNLGSTQEEPFDVTSEADLSDFGGPLSRTSFIKAPYTNKTLGNAIGKKIKENEKLETTLKNKIKTYQDISRYEKIYTYFRKQVALLRKQASYFNGLEGSSDNDKKMQKNIQKKLRQLDLFFEKEKTFKKDMKLPNDVFEKLLCSGPAQRKEILDHKTLLSEAQKHEISTFLEDSCVEVLSSSDKDVVDALEGYLSLKGTDQERSKFQSFLKSLTTTDPFGQVDLSTELVEKQKTKIEEKRKAVKCDLLHLKLSTGSPWSGLLEEGAWLNATTLGVSSDKNLPKDNTATKEYIAKVDQQLALLDYGGDVGDTLKEALKKDLAQCDFLFDAHLSLQEKQDFQGLNLENCINALTAGDQDKLIDLDDAIETLEDTIKKYNTEKDGNLSYPLAKHLQKWLRILKLGRLKRIWDRFKQEVLSEAELEFKKQVFTAWLTHLKELTLNPIEVEPEGTITESEKLLWDVKNEACVLDDALSSLSETLDSLSNQLDGAADTSQTRLVIESFGCMKELDKTSFKLRNLYESDAYQRLLDREADFDPESSLSVDVDSLVYNINNTPLDELEWKIDVMGRHITTLVAQSEERASKNKVKSDDNEKSLSDFKQAINGYLKLITRKGERLYAHSTKTDGDKDRVLDFSLKEVRDDFQALSYWVDRFELVGSNAKNIKEKLQQEFNQKIWNLQCGEKQQGGSSGQVSVLNTRYNQAVRDQFFAIEELPIKDKTAGPLLISKQLHPDTGFNELRMYYNPLLRLLGTVSQDMKYESHYEVVETLSDRVLNDYVQGLSIAFSSTLKKGNEIKNQVLFSKEQLSGFDDHMRNHIVTSLRERLRTIIPFHEPMAKDGTVDPFVLEIDQAGNFVLSMRVADGFPSSSKVAYETVIQELKDRFYSFPLKRADQIKESLEGGDVRTVAHKKWISQQLVSKYGKETGTSHTKQSEHYRHADSFSNKHITNEDITKKHILNFQGNASKEIYTKLEERKKSVVESFGKRTSIVNTKVMPLVEKINKIFEEKEKTALNIKNQSNKIQTGSDLKSEVPSATTKVKLKFNKKEAVQVEQYLTCLEDVLKKTEGMDKESQKTTLFLYFGKLIGKMKDQMGVYALYKNSLVPFCRGTEEGVQYDFSHSEELGEMIDIALNILDACKPGEMSINWKDVHDAKNKWNKNMDNGKLKSDFKSDAQEKVVDELKVALQTVEQAKNEIIEGSTDTQLLSGAILSLMGDKINPKIDGYSYTKNELDAFFNDKTVKERLQQVDAKQLQAIFKELNNQSTPIDFQDFKALSSVKTAIGDDDSLKETGSNASKSLQGTEAGKTNFIAPIEAKLTKGLQKQFATAIWNALDDGIKQEWKDISPDQTDSSDKTKGPLNTFDNFFIEKMNDCVGDAIKDGSDIEKIRGKLTDLSGNGSGSQGSKITSLTAMLSEHMLGIDNKSKHKFLQKLIRKKYGLVQGLDSEDSNAEFSLKKTAKDVLEGTGVFNIDTSQLDDYRQLEFELLRLEFAQKLATESSNGDITVAQIIPALHQKNALSVAVAMESYCQSAYKNGWGEIKGAGTKDPKFDLLNSLEYEIEKYDDSKIQQFIERLAAEPENAQKNSEQDETKEPLSNTSERALLKAQHQDKNETNQGDNALKIDHGNELLLACKIWDAKTKNNHSEEKPANALKQTTAMKHVFDVYKTLDPMQQHVMMLFQGSCEKGNRYFNYSAVKKDKNLTMEETTSTQYKFLEKALNDNFLKNLNISEGEGKRKIPMQDLCGKVALEMDDAGVRAGSVKIHSSRLLDEKNSFPSDIKENLNAKKLYFFLRAMVVENRLDQLKEDGKINLDPNNTTSSDLVGGSLSSGTFDDLEKRVDELFDKVPEDLRKDVETIEKDKYVNEVQSAGLSDDFNLSKESISPYQAILEKMGLWNKDQDNETLNNGIFDEGSKKRKLQEAVCEFLFRFPSSEELDIKKIAEGLSDNKNTDNFSGALINLATNMPEPDANARGTSLLTMNMAKGDPDVGGENKYDSFIELLYCLSKKINIVADTGDSLKHLQEPASQFFKRLAVIDVLNYNAVLNKGYHDTENPAEIIIGKIEGNIDDSDSKSVAASELFKDLCVHKLTIKGSKKSDTGEKSFQEEYDKEVKRGFSKDQIKQKICGDLYGANEGGFGRFIEKQLKNQQLFVYEAFDGDKVSNTGITNKTVENLKKIWQYSEKDSSFKSVSAYLETIGEESLSEFFKIETNEGSTDPNQKTIDNNKLTSPLWAFVETPTGQKDDVETSTDQESQKQNPVMTWLDKNIKDFKQESQKKLIDKIFEKIKGNKKTHKISLPDLLDCISTVQSEEGKDTGKHTVSTVETPKNIYAELDTSELDQISSVGQAVKKQLYAKALSARLAQRWDKRLATDLVLTQGEADSYFLSEKVIEIINLNKEDVLKEEIKNLDLGSKLDSNSVSQRKPPETKDSYSELFETDNSNDRPSFFSTNSPINKTAIKRAVLTEMKDQISNEFSGELKGKLPDKTKNIFDSCFSSKSDNESNEQVDFAQCNVTKRLLNGYNTNEELDGFIGKDTNQTKILTQIVQSEADTKAIFEKEETRSDDYPILNHVLSTCVKQTISENSQIDQGFLETTDLYKTLQGTLKEEASDYISKASGIVGKTQKDNQRLDLDDPFPKSKEIFEGLLKQNAIKETQALETDTPLLKLFNTSNALKQKDGSLSQDIKLLPEKLDKNTDPKTATLNQMQLTYNGISELRKNESQSLDLLKWPDSESENGTKKECDFLTWCQTELGSSSSSKADIDMENNETENSLANYDNKAGEWKYNNLLAAMAKQLVKLGVTPNPEISDFGEIDFPKNIIRGGNDVKSIYFLLHATLDAFKSEGTKSFKETYIDKDGKINADAFKKALNKKQTEKEKADKAKKTINEKLKGLGAPEHIQDAIETMLTGQQDGENEEIDTTYQLDPTKLLTNIEGSEELIDAIKLAKDADTEIDSKIDVLLDDSTIWKTSPSDDKKDEVRGNRKSYLKKLFESAKFIRGITGFINKEKEVLRLAQRKMISCLKETPSSINAIDFGPAYNNSQLLKHMKAEKQRRKYKAYQAFREKINTESGRWTFNPRFFLQGMRKTGPEQLTGNKRPNDYLNTFERQIEDTKDDFFSNGIKDELVPNIIIQTIKTSHGASSLDKNYLDIPDTDVTYGELVAGLKDKLNNEQWNSIVRLFLDESNDAMIQSSLALETDMFIETTNLFSVSQPKNKDDLKETYTTPRYLTIPQAYQNYFSSKSSSDSDVSSTTDNNHDVAIRVLYNSSATNVDSKSSPSKYYTHQYNTNYYTLNNESKFVLGELTMDPNELLKSSGVDEKGLDSDDQSTTFSKDLVKMWLSQLNTSERQWCLAFFESTLQELLGEIGRAHV